MVGAGTARIQRKEGASVRAPWSGKSRQEEYLQSGVLPLYGGSTGAVGEPTPGTHLPEEVGSSCGVWQYIRLRGGARLFPLMYAGRPRDNGNPHRR